MWPGSLFGGYSAGFRPAEHSLLFFRDWPEQLWFVLLRDLSPMSRAWIPGSRGRPSPRFVKIAHLPGILHDITSII